jgi:hypothetical protein
MRESGHGICPGLLPFGVHSVFGEGSLDLIEHTEDRESGGGSGMGEVSPLIVGRFRSPPPFRGRSIGR